FDADGKTSVLLEAGGEQALELDVHPRLTEGGIAVVEQEGAAERFVAVGELMEQKGRSGGGVHRGSIAEQAEKLEANGLARVFLTGADVERRGKGCAGNDVSMHGPKGKQVQLLLGAVEVLLVEVDDLVDQVVGLGHIRLLGKSC